jgi:hypothetical protein
MKISACVFLGAMFATPIVLAQDAQPQQLGGAGESCRARSDCKGGLRCVNQVCTDEHEGQQCGATSECGGELRCIANKCTSPTATQNGGGASSSGSNGPAASSDDWMKFNPFDGNVHPYAGVTIAGGFMTVGASGNTPFTGGFNTFRGAFLLALNGGIYMGQHQLSFEISPVTYWPTLASPPGPAFEMSANYAYMIPLTESGNMRVFWPIRFGIGMAAGPDLNLLGLAWFQMRADLIGAAIQVGHVVIDLHLPTFRYAITDKNGVQGHLLDWLFGASIGYVF